MTESGNLRRRGAASALSSLAALAIALASCATARVSLDRADAAAANASAHELAAAGLEAWVSRGDVTTAERRIEQALRRDGADPWARMGAALLARRHLDDSGEAAHLIALVNAAPGHALASLAARRLGLLAESAPPMAKAVEAGLAPAQERLQGLTAARARVARRLAATALGERDRAEALRRESGSVPAWTLSGPFGALHAFQMDTPFAPETGRLPQEVPGADGLPTVSTRSVPCPDGDMTLEGEPLGGDIYYLATDAVVERGGEYLLSAGGSASFRVFVDGAPAIERRADAGFPPFSYAVPIALRPGPHHLLVKVARGNARVHLGVSLLRADGGRSDVVFAPTAPGAPLPPARSGERRQSVNLARDVLPRLEAEVTPGVARLVVAREALETDRETAKALIAEALQRAPSSPALLALRAEATRDDPTLADRIARSRAEADLDRSLAADPADAASRVMRAELAAVGERLDDAASWLDGLPEGDAARPRALVARARVARARGLADVAERLAEEARRTGGDCAALDLLFGLVTRREAFSRQDELAVALARCPGGHEQLAEHRRRRGDLPGALAAADEAARAAPARVEPRFTRGAILVAAGRAQDAAHDLEDLARLWPRDARIEKRRAEFLEAAGDAVAARAARERALLLDGSDLALRRALSLESGREPLDDVAEDGLEAIARYRAAAPRHATSSVTVLDFGAVEAHLGGSYTERVHTVVEARDERAVDHVGEVTIPDGAELLVARTVKRDGRVLDAEEPLGDKRTLSLSGLEPGDFAEWEWIRTVPPRGPAVPGFTADAFFFRGDSPLWRSTYVVSAPAALRLELDAHHLPAVEPAHDGDRHVVRITREDVTPLLPEPNAPGDAEHLPFIQAGSGAGQETLAVAMADALLEAFRPTLELTILAAEIKASAPPGTGSEGLVRAAYRRVNELVLGGGGFNEPASSILSRGRGNRTVVLKALLDALGVKSRIVLIRDITRDPARYRFPRPELYGYAVLRVEHAGGMVWLDPSTRGTPFGVLPGVARGAEALVLPAPGEPLVSARTPAGGSEDERRLTQLEVVLDARGGATVDAREEYRGVEAAALRASLERLDAPARRQALEQALSRSFRGPSLARFEVEGESDLEAPLVVRWRARVERWARLEPGRAVVDTPLLPARLGARFLERATRETQLLVAVDERSSLQMTIKLPQGWTALAAPEIDVSGPYGRYQRRERTEEGRLVRADTYELNRWRVAPDDYPAFATFARAVDAAQEQPMVFHRATTIAGAGAAATERRAVPAASAQR